MGHTPDYEEKRQAAMESYVRARQGLTLDQFVEFERVEEMRRRSEGQLLVDWYVLLHRSYVMRDVADANTDE